MRQYKWISIFFEKALPLVRAIPEANVVDLKSVLSEVRRSLANETNFLQEMKNAQEFYRNNHQDPQLALPRVYPEWCTQKVLVMDYMAGESLNCLLTRKNQDIVYDNTVSENREKTSGDAISRKLYETSL